MCSGHKVGLYCSWQLLGLSGIAEELGRGQWGKRSCNSHGMGRGEGLLCSISFTIPILLQVPFTWGSRGQQRGAKLPADTDGVFK